MISRKHLKEHERQTLCQALIWAYEHAETLAIAPGHNPERWHDFARHAEKLYRQVSNVDR